MKQVIDGNNKAILKNAQNPEENQPKKMCNCRKEKECPLEGECLQNEIVYHSYHQGGKGNYWDVRRPYSNRFQNKMAQPPNVS